MFDKKYSVNLPTLIACVIVSVAVSAPLSSAANDQVRIVVKKVTGKQGKRGPRGFTGKQGPVGPRGPAGPQYTPPVKWADYSAKYLLPGETVTVIQGGCAGRVNGGSLNLSWGGKSDPGLDVLDEGIGEGGLFYFGVVKNETSEVGYVKAVSTCGS